MGAMVDEDPSLVCPHCGAEVRPGALACRECGSDAETGWGDPDEISSLGALTSLPDALDPELPAPRPTGGRRGLRIAGILGLGLAAAGILVWAVGWQIGVRAAAVVAVIALAVSFRITPAPGTGTAR
jgi:hypothetical protein